MGENSGNDYGDDDDDLGLVVAKYSHLLRETLAGTLHGRPSNHHAHHVQHYHLPKTLTNTVHMF